MRKWVAKIRIIDDGDAGDGIIDYIKRETLERELLCMGFGMSGVDVSEIISLEEEEELPKD